MTSGGARTNLIQIYPGLEYVGMLWHLGAYRSPTLRQEPPRVLFLGEDNPQSADPTHALFNAPVGCAGHRLQNVVLGLPSSVYLGQWRTNLCNPAWHLASARSRFKKLMGKGHPWSVVVVLGSKVLAVANDWLRDTFKSGDGWPAGLLPQLTTYNAVGWSDSTAAPPCSLVALPHPSGRCREWNEPDAIIKSRRAVACLAPELWA